MALNDDNRITLDDLPSEIDSPARINLLESLPYIEHQTEVKTMPLSGGSIFEAEDARNECMQLMATLKKEKWNITRVAQSLGICRATVYRKMAKFQIVEPNDRE